ncbi:MAG: hypothetical protein IJB86_04080 [Clostridia bacterium]|nr:hypothetical protein [Clostridia bacterium]
MKKILSVIFAFAILFTFASCGTTSAPEETEAPEETALQGVSAPVDILNTVWASYAEEEKFFAMGGSPVAPVDGAPGAFDVSDVETLAAQLVCTGDAVAMIDDAASIMHAMNANTFTGAAYHLSDSANKDAFVAAMKDSISTNQWMCGFPEKLLIVSVADYVVVTFGAADITETFKTKLLSAYEIAVVEIEEAIA